jgi:competence protein ComEC
MADGSFVALTFKSEALADDCSRALLLVTARQVPTACVATVINAERLRQHGAIALRRSRRGFDVDAVKPKGLDRPWAPAGAGDADTESGTLGVRAAASSTVDATPAEADLQAED